MEKLKSDHEDILSVRIKILQMEVRMLIVYFAAGNKKEDKERNKQIKQKCENILENINEDPLIILGDFNGHVGFLGHQRLDTEGETILKWVNEYGLIIINGDEQGRHAHGAQGGLGPPKFWCKEIYL